MNAASCAPVLLTVFNRPEETGRVLEILQRIRPPQIFVAADGPRAGRADDAENCALVRRMILDRIDWTDGVVTDFSPVNMGLRRRMASAIGLALEQADRVIVLEDDCVPHPDFFRFCTELLKRYASDERVGVITGDNFQPGDFCCGESFYFSRYPHCWGWATWRRAWAHYDDAMADWPGLRGEGWLEELFPHPLEAGYWRKIFDDVFAGEIESWAYRWTWSCWRRGMLTATPAVNLVTNIGTGDAATNTRDAEKDKHRRAALPLDFPLCYPADVERNTEADAFAQRHVFGLAKDRSLPGRVKRFLSKAAKKFSGPE